MDEIHQKRYGNFYTFLEGYPHFCPSYPQFVIISGESNIMDYLFYSVCFVDNVDKLETALALWIMWISYPQFLWITWKCSLLCG